MDRLSWAKASVPEKPRAGLARQLLDGLVVGLPETVVDLEEVLHQVALAGELRVLIEDRRNHLLQEGRAEPDGSLPKLSGKEPVLEAGLRPIPGRVFGHQPDFRPGFQVVAIAENAESNLLVSVGVGRVSGKEVGTHPDSGDRGVFSHPVENTGRAPLSNVMLSGQRLDGGGTDVEGEIPLHPSPVAAEEPAVGVVAGGDRQPGRPFLNLVTGGHHLAQVEASRGLSAAPLEEEQPRSRVAPVDQREGLVFHLQHYRELLQSGLGVLDLEHQRGVLSQGGKIAVQAHLGRLSFPAAQPERDQPPEEEGSQRQGP